jgi:hypothetical protein
MVKKQPMRGERMVDNQKKRKKYGIYSRVENDRDVEKE